MTDKWQAGKTYVPGSLVVPASAVPVVMPPLVNGDFETGDLSSWTATAQPGNWSISNFAYRGTYCLHCVGGNVATIRNDTRGQVEAGTQVSAQAVANFHNNGTDDMGCELALYWYDASDAFISQDEGASLTGKGGSYKAFSVLGYAPTNAKFVRLVIGANTGTHGGDISFDNVTWSSNYSAPPSGLVYKATQAAPGKSGTSEPSWPGVTGVPVMDNQVTWEGVIATRIVWQAIPLLKSGDTEPTWPLDVSGMVLDGTVGWQATSRRITDVNCPHSKIVAIAAGKVYAADDDIIRYCATVNPLDWSSTNDAGYLPFGLQTYGSNPVAAMNLYRSNLVPFNAEGFQMWQVDADPANTNLLDALPVATTYNKALAPVANDLLFLSSQGVRSIGIAASSTNLQAGDVGMPIDVLVKAALDSTLDAPRATFLPALGQYWLAINAADRTNCTVFVYTLNQIGQVGKWGRYVFPFPVDDFMILDDDLYLRSGDDVLRYDETVTIDFAGDNTRAKAYPGIVQYQWLDFGRPGVPKQVIGFDLVGSGNPTFALGYDQSNEGTFTTDFAVPADTVPGQIIPLPVMAPSMSVRVSYAGGQAWQLQAVSLYLQDMRPGS